MFSQLCLGRSFDGIDRSRPTAQTRSRVAGWKGSSQSRGQSRPKEHREPGGRRLGTACGHNLEAKRKQAARKQDIGGGLAEKGGARLLQPELVIYSGQSFPMHRESSEKSHG